MVHIVLNRAFRRLSVHCFDRFAGIFIDRVQKRGGEGLVFHLSSFDLVVHAVLREQLLEQSGSSPAFIKTISPLSPVHAPLT